MSDRQILDNICETVDCTQTYLAEELGVTKQLVSAWRTGKAKMRKYHKLALMWLIWNEKIEYEEKAQLGNMILDSMEESINKWRHAFSEGR